MQKIDFRLHPSKFYCFFLALTLVMSVVVVIALSVSMLFKALLAGLVMAYGWMIYRRYALLRSPLSIIGFAKLENGKWQVSTRVDHTEAVLKGDSTVTSLVTILRFQFPGRRLPVASIIMRDSLNAEAYRQLIATLRMG
jgi:hypothetical protein